MEHCSTTDGSQDLYTSTFHLNTREKKLLYFYFSMNLMMDMNETGKFRNKIFVFVPRIVVIRSVIFQRPMYHMLQRHIF